MSLSRYTEYGDSRIKWLGEVPAHWEITKTKHTCGFTTGWTPPTGDSSGYEGENLWANISDLGPKELNDTAKRISDAAVRQAGIALSPSGSLLFSFKLSIGQVSFAGRDMYTNEAIATFRRSKKLDLAFAYYAFPLYLVQNAAVNIYGAKLLNQELIKGAHLVLPPVEEQSAIAAFLDRETAKIDALIAEQEKLIALLAEKRQATISHAVTRGLDPDAPMKDSGVAWLGEVPAHWEFMPIKRDLAFLTSGSRGWAEHYADEGALFIRIGNLTRDDIKLDLSDIQRVAVPPGAEGERTSVRPGDVLISITAYLGSVAVVPDDVEAAFVSQHVALARPTGKKLLPQWIAYAVKSIIGVTYLETQGYGGTKIQLSLDDVANLPLTVPSISEQSGIIDFIRNETTKIDALTKEANTGISLLKERRAALISAVVTGEVDVRSTTLSSSDSL